MILDDLEECLLPYEKKWQKHMLTLDDGDFTTAAGQEYVSANKVRNAIRNLSDALRDHRRNGFDL